MTVSDFLTLLALALAVWAIVPRSERRFVELFFSRTEIVILFVGLGYIHWLLAYNWLLSHWLPVLAYFTCTACPSPNTYAYVLALGLIAYPVFKVRFGFFHQSQKEKLISLYRSLLQKGETDLLITYIEKYHLKHIKNYLRQLSSIREIAPVNFFLRISNKEEQKLQSDLRIDFAVSVYEDVIQHEEYIEKTTPNNPNIIATISRSMLNEKSANEYLIKPYIEILFESKNPNFIRELKELDKDHASIKERMSKGFELPIIFGLFQHMKAAKANNVWYPVGKGASLSLKYDQDQIGFLTQPYDSDLEPELWNCKAYLAIVYFNFMVRESIHHDPGYHMWLNHYSNLISQLINLPLDKNQASLYSHNEHPNFAFRLIYMMFDNMYNWITLAIELKVDHRVAATIKCIGFSLVFLNLPTDSDSLQEKLENKLTIKVLDLFIQLWFELKYTETSEVVDLALSCLTSMFLNPANPDNVELDVTKYPTHLKYKQNLEHTWNKFDIEEYKFYSNQFQDEVLKKLDIQI